MNTPIFDTDRRIRLGIWGLGRGTDFYETAKALNFEVVAGCDYNEHMRRSFLESTPGAFATADAEEFLGRDFDAVLLATFCPGHAADALRCLAAGKHVLSEVTAFFTMAEGVELVEAVEKSGLVYNLAENYPFTPVMRYLKRRWDEGLFGNLMYAEFEYVHECRSLAYTYIDGTPVQPGDSVHTWRSWMNFHYYCTHSLGPVMIITGERPTEVVALPAGPRLAGYLPLEEEGMGGVAPSLVKMSGGGIVRNLMGATTNDSHVQRLWGTLGSAEVNVGEELKLRLGGSGHSPKMAVTPTGDELDTLARSTGHGGGDFWVLYYFARQILTGERAPFDVYVAADGTIPGIQVVRSARSGGQPMPVPDFRDPKQRDQYRHDTWRQGAYDTRGGLFPAGADRTITTRFSRAMADLIRCSLLYRQWADWSRVRHDMTDPDRLRQLKAELLEKLPEIRGTYAAARQLINAYPESDAACVLREMLENVGDERRVMAPDFDDELGNSSEL